MVTQGTLVSHQEGLTWIVLPDAGEAASVLWDVCYSRTFPRHLGSGIPVRLGLEDGGPGPPWQLSGKEGACSYRKHRFNP